MLSALRGFAQEAVSAAESQKMIEQVCVAAGKLSSLQCDFRQTKQLSLLKTALKSEGKMYYKGGKQLHWEYTSPYTYTFVLSGDKVMLKSAKNTDVIDVRSSKMFQQIARIMMNSVTGRCLTDEKDFKVTMFASGKEWIARLIPCQKELAQMFQEIRLHIDPEQQMVTTVELQEKSGDTTLIEMKNIQKNVTIDDEVFDIK